MRYIIFLILFVVVANSQTIKQGESIDIVSCDEHKWCKIKGTKRYIKGYKFKEADGKYVLKPAYKEAFYYSLVTNGENFTYLPIINNNTNTNSNKLTNKPNNTSFDDNTKAKKPKNKQTKDIYRLNEIHHDDVILVDSCDKHNWCKLQNSKYYIRGYLFDKDGDKYTLKDRYEKTYYYWSIKNSTFGYNKVLKRGEQNNKYQKSIKVLEEKKDIQNIEQQKISNTYINKKINIEKPKPSYIFKPDYFVQFSGGLSKVDVKTDIEKRLLKKDLDDTGAALDIAVGAQIKNFFATVNYGFMAYDNINMKNIYTTINYKFDNKSVSPYIGLLVGYGSLKWLESPLTISRNEKLSSNSNMVGLQIGINTKLTEKWHFNINYQYIKYDYTMDINDAQYYIDHKTQNNFTIGIKYIF